MLIPSTTGRGLVNLVAELEQRLTGEAVGTGLEAALADRLPSGDSLCLVLFDGLGAAQAAEVDTFRSSLAGVIHAPFPTTTTVSLSTIATGRTVPGHGVVGHLMWLPQVESVVNVLKFVTPSGTRVELDYQSFLPEPNLWERLRNAGIEPVTVQPGPFADSPLSQVLYRGCRFEAAWNASEWVDAVADLSSRPGRFVFGYWPDVDVAAHVSGRSSAEYRRTVTQASRLWDRLRQRVTAPLIATADHGHLDYSESGKHLLRDPDMDRAIWFGDPRALMIRGDREAAERITQHTGAEWFGRDQFSAWLGADRSPHPELESRLPDAVALAAPGTLLLPPAFDRRLIGYHGGLEREEVEIPILVG
ncbi:MAG: alkaline phosphatase family protein [Acidimicrobiia bacterium]|nr:alkaline phosphatase family protein [Acidimicrobiia bacterium]